MKVNIIRSQPKAVIIDEDNPFPYYHRGYIPTHAEWEAIKARVDAAYAQATAEDIALHNGFIEERDRKEVEGQQ